MSKIMNLHAVAPPTETNEMDETDKMDEMDADLVEFGIASDLTRGSGGRSGESSYPKP